MVPHFRLEFRGSFFFLCSLFIYFLSLFIRRVLVALLSHFWWMQSFYVEILYFCTVETWISQFFPLSLLLCPFLCMRVAYYHGKWHYVALPGWVTHVDPFRLYIYISHIFLGTTNSELSLALSCRIWSCRSFYQSMCMRPSLNLYTLVPTSASVSLLTCVVFVCLWH